MKYYVDVDGRERVVELVERHGQLTVLVAGRRLELDYCEVDAHGQVSLLAGTDSYAVSIEGGANAFSITIAGHLYCVAIEDERERAAHAAARANSKQGGVLKSVMPGVVVELLVAEGDLVSAGQPLLILEAMKMQNEIRSEAHGRIAQLFVRAGQAVGAGAKLAALEAAPDEA